ncbi:WD repeat-containing protein 3-like [Babylonia areolata]|uniref:WD repeat-containing protein 3-like n=1 Tax=Babylonia areolata TaxID=304850 RepID=UPI003FD03DCD
MGVTKQYLRVEQNAVFGLVATHASNVVLLNAGGRAARLAAVGACERVLVWDLRTQELVHKLFGDRHEVTSLTRSPDHSHLAVGYRDGYIRVFNIQTGPVDDPVVFCCHRRAVTALAYDHDGMRLAAGSQDTDVTVLDTVSNSGLCRLKGHTNEITKVSFFKGRDILITSSKDKLVKFWDLQLQHCFKTLVGHRTEVYSFVLLNNDHRLLTGCADSELRIWDITFRDEVSEEDQDSQAPAKRARQSENSDEEGDEEEERFQPLRCESRGSVMREGREKVSQLVTDPSQRFLLCHGPGKKCEVFVLATEEELQKKLKKRRKKAKRKAEMEGEMEEGEEVVVTVEDEVRRVNSFKLDGKLRGLDVVTTDTGRLKVAALLNNNMVQTTEVHMVDSHNVQCEDTTSISRFGHRTEVRTLAFSSDSHLILSASAEELKLWSRTSLQCIRSMECEYALCSTFVPGDQYAIIGTKSGKLQVFDIGSGTLVSSVSAHEDTVWSLSLAPKDQNGIVTGSKDQTVRFWKFELVTSTEDQSQRKHLSLVHTRTLKMDDQITCVTYSPDQRLLAVALLDNTVKVFFVDTLKLFHTLYGGSSPVLCMDISSDSTIIATGSADKNVKLWGLDFGDLKKSIFAHDDSVSCVKFVPRTHLLFSAGKDRLVKQWDADNFEHIITLKGHHSEVRALAVSPCGYFTVTSGHDLSLRLWEKTDGILVLEDEREMEREEEENEAIAQSDEPVVAGEDVTEVMAVRKNVETLKGAENLIETLDIYEEETKKLAEHAARCKTSDQEIPKPTVHPKMLAYRAESPADFVLKTLQKIRSSDLEQVLLVLPFQYVTRLLPVLEIFLTNGVGWDPELCCHCVTFLLRIHHGQITANQVLMPTIVRLRNQLQARTQEMKDTLGFNLFAMKMIQLKLEEQQEVKLFADATAKFKQKKKKRKVHAPLIS